MGGGEEEEIKIRKKGKKLFFVIENIVYMWIGFCNELPD